jgi:YfiH family protein
VKQVHGRAVRVVRQSDELSKSSERWPEADAMVTDVPGITLAVQVADCVPVLIADTGSTIAAAIHAGWRGSSLEVARAAVDTLKQEFATSPADLIVAMGPSIGACCYNVGDEVLETFRSRGNSDAQLARWFARAEDGSLWLDLWAVNRDQLVGAGVRAENIHSCRLCTKTHATLFDSYRVDGPQAGRMAAVIESQ